EHDGSHSVQLNLANPLFPTAIPHISNFTAAQTINPDADFTLTWDAFVGAGLNDYVELEVQDSGAEIFAAKTTGTSATIPAGTLGADSSYDVVVRFVKETARDTTSYPGATGSAGFYNETQLSISTGTGDGGGPDTQFPVLFLTSPTSGAANVGVNTTITFTFSEPMADKHSIEWSLNLNPS